jgi:hypothetical protein
MKVEINKYQRSKGHFISGIGIDFYYQRGYFNYIAVSIHLILFSIGIKQGLKQKKK